MRTICLVIPPSPFLLDERVFMTLGILKVAAVLEQAGDAVELLDLSGVENFTDAVRHHAQSSPASHFGITATTPQMPAAAAVCRAIQQVRTDATVILGGPHITLVNAAARRERNAGQVGRATRALAQLERLFDVLVAGDGELAIFPALRERAPKLIDADQPSSLLFLGRERLTQLPLPARHLIDVHSYRYSIDGARAVSLIAQLGCPFNCGFCGGRDSPSLRRTRSRSTAAVLTEIEHLHTTYGFTGFMFYDDELNVNPKLIELLQGIEALQQGQGCEFCLRGFVKAELFTEEQAAEMYRAGFRWLLSGFESGSPRILRNMNKRATREDNTRCVEIAHRHGLKVKALMSLGHPGESAETVEETERWLLEVAPDDFDVTLITTYPGSPYYDHAVPHPSQPAVWTYETHGDRLHGYEIDYLEVADYYKGNPDGGYVSYVFTDLLSAERLVELRNSVERTVRAQLNIPFYPSAQAIRYEHSMGMGPLPQNLLRRSETWTSTRKTGTMG